MCIHCAFNVSDGHLLCLCSLWHVHPLWCAFTVHSRLIHDCTGMCILRLTWIIKGTNQAGLNMESCTIKPSLMECLPGALWFLCWIGFWMLRFMAVSAISWLKMVHMAHCGAKSLWSTCQTLLSRIIANTRFACNGTMNSYLYGHRWNKMVQRNTRQRSPPGSGQISVVGCHGVAQAHHIACTREAGVHHLLSDQHTVISRVKPSRIGYQRSCNMTSYVLPGHLGLNAINLFDHILQ